MSLFKATWFRVVMTILAVFVALSVPFGISWAQANYKTSIMQQYIEINKRYPVEIFSGDVDSDNAANLIKSCAREYKDLETKLLSENTWHSFITKQIVEDVSRNMYEAYCKQQVLKADVWLSGHN